MTPALLKTTHRAFLENESPPICEVRCVQRSRSVRCARESSKSKKSVLILLVRQGRGGLNLDVEVTSVSHKMVETAQRSIVRALDWRQARLLFRRLPVSCEVAR